MRFFEAREPYYAVICAENEDKFMDYYVQTIADIEDRDEFKKELVELEMTVAITKVANSISEETHKPIGLNEASDQIFECLNDNKTCLLVADGAFA